MHKALYKTDHNSFFGLFAFDRPTHSQTERERRRRGQPKDCARGMDYFKSRSLALPVQPMDVCALGNHAADYEAKMKSRDEELAALAKTTEALKGLQALFVETLLPMG